MERVWGFCFPTVFDPWHIFYIKNIPTCTTDQKKFQNDTLMPDAASPCVPCVTQCEQEQKGSGMSLTAVAHEELSSKWEPCGNSSVNQKASGVSFTVALQAGGINGSSSVRK